MNLRAILFGLVALMAAGGTILGAKSWLDAQRLALVQPFGPVPAGRDHLVMDHGRCSNRCAVAMRRLRQGLRCVALASRLQCFVLPAVGFDFCSLFLGQDHECPL